MGNLGPMTNQPNEPIPLEVRLGFAMVGIIAGNAVMLIFSFWIRNGGLDFFIPYAALAIPGWILVGIPVALFFPARLVTSVWWPIVCLAIGAALGPLAVFLILLVMGIANRQLAFDHTEQSFALSVPASTVSFAVYAVLVRRRALKQIQSDAIADLAHP